MKASLIIAVALVGTSGLFAQEADRKENNQPVAQTEKSAEELKVTDQELEKRVSEVNKATKFIGMQVKNPRNETVGKVSDMALDLKSGRIAYAVVSVGGFLGVGNKMVAVPVEALTVEKGAKHLLLDVDKQQVEQAAGFSENSWPDLDAVKSGKTIGFTAKANADKGVGGTGSDAEEARGTERADQRRSSQPVISISGISANREPSTLNGRQVRLTGVKVQEVFEGNFATVGSDQDRQKVLIKAPTGSPQLQAGQTINLTGTIRELPSELSQVGLDANTAQKVQGQKVYIDAGQVTPTAQK